MVTNEIRMKNKKGPLGARTNKGTRSGPYLTLSKLCILARTVCLHSLKMAPVMRLKSKECILENQTDSVKAEDEILYNMILYFGYGTK